MEIGKPKRTFTVEPLESPVPQKRPLKTDQPQAPARPEPEPKPARV